jgi:hypothetical protein
MNAKACAIKTHKSHNTAIASHGRLFPEDQRRQGLAYVHRLELQEPRCMSSIYCGHSMKALHATNIKVPVSILSPTLPHSKQLEEKLRILLLTALL